MQDNRSVRVIELKDMIEDAIQAVNDSSFGPLMVNTTNPDNLAESKKIVNQVSFQVFMTILQSLVVSRQNNS